MTDEDAHRYRRAAEFTLEQLDWCITYLRSIRRVDIARTLARSRDEIRRRLREIER
jgi:hypothetical protein